MRAVSNIQYRLNYVNATGRRLAVARWACGGDLTEFAAPTLLIVPPFAEEMNKARRMFAELGRQAAAEGWVVLLPDLTGTGESAWDLSDASWGTWTDDLRCVLRAELDQRKASGIAVLGLRTGALLAAQIASEAAACPLVLWQPVTEGRRYLTQFLRLRVAGAFATSGNIERTSTEDLRRCLDSGSVVEVAGYRVPPEIARGMDSARLSEFPPGKGNSVLCLEVADVSSEEISLASERVLSRWREEGAHVSRRTVLGAPFWVTTEISEVPALITETVDFLRTVACQ